MSDGFKDDHFNSVERLRESRTRFHRRPDVEFTQRFGRIQGTDSRDMEVWLCTAKNRVAWGN